MQALPTQMPLHRRTRAARGPFGTHFLKFESSSTCSPRRLLDIFGGVTIQTNNRRSSGTTTCNAAALHCPAASSSCPNSDVSIRCLHSVGNADRGISAPSETSAPVPFPALHFEAPGRSACDAPWRPSMTSSHAILLKLGAMHQRIRQPLSNKAPPTMEGILSKPLSFAVSLQSFRTEFSTSRANRSRSVREGATEGGTG